jgi:hypothetical protein
MARDKRRAKRRTVRYGAWLALADGSLSECVLSDISESGARLVVDDSAVVPEKFVLVLSLNGAARRGCKVVWRNPQQVGVKFDQIGASEAKVEPPKPAVPGRAPSEGEKVERVSLPA